MLKHKSHKRFSYFALIAVLSAGALGIGISGAQAVGATEPIELSWDGSEYSSMTSVSYFGTPVTVPGDRADRTLYVQNAGPTAGVLTARITNVSLLNEGAVDEHHNPTHEAPDSSGLYNGAGNQGNFYDDIVVTWANGAASLTKLHSNGVTQLVTVPVARGAVVPIELTYDFLVASTAGNQSNVDYREASFDVELVISGDSGAVLEKTGGTSQGLLSLGAITLILLAVSLLTLKARRNQIGRT